MAYFQKRGRRQSKLSTRQDENLKIGFQIFGKNLYPPSYIEYYLNFVVGSIFTCDGEFSPLIVVMGS